LGLYDTFIFDNPIPCSVCGAPIKSVQSKAFRCSLDYLRVGDALSDRCLRLGVVEEDLYCDSCSSPQEGPRPKVFLVIWHGIYAGAYATMREAEARLAGIDRVTLLEWHDRQQKEKEDWRRRFHSLRSALSDWHDYTLAEDKDAFLKKPMAFFRSGLREAAAKSDPLGAILEEYGKEAHEEDDADIFGI
jgi:hypothetical protein